MNHSGQMMTMDTRGIVATSRGSKESIFSTNRGRIIILLLLICIPLISYWEDVVIIFSQPLTQNNGIKSSQQSQDAFNSYKLNTPLFEAVKSDDIELVRKLLNDGENTDNNNNNNGGKVVYYNVNAEDPKGLTPLIEATLIGNVDLVKLLLLHGAKAQPLPGFRHTPLRAACLTGNTELITLLIEQGADPNAKSEGGRTPLMGACYLRPQYDESPDRIEISYEAVRVMLEADSRVDPTIRNDFNESAMDLCKQRGYTKSMGILRDRITGSGKRRMRRR